MEKVKIGSYIRSNGDEGVVIESVIGDDGISNVLFICERGLTVEELKGWGFFTRNYGHVILDKNKRYHFAPARENLKVLAIPVKATKLSRKLYEGRIIEEKDGNLIINYVDNK